MMIGNKGVLKPAVCPMVDWVHYGSSQVASHISWLLNTTSTSSQYLPLKLTKHFGENASQAGKQLEICWYWNRHEEVGSWKLSGND